MCNEVEDPTTYVLYCTVHKVWSLMSRNKYSRRKGKQQIILMARRIRNRDKRKSKPGSQRFDLILPLLSHLSSTEEACGYIKHHFQKEKAITMHLLN